MMMYSYDDDVLNGMDEAVICMQGKLGLVEHKSG